MNETNSSMTQQWEWLAATINVVSVLKMLVALIAVLGSTVAATINVESVLKMLVALIAVLGSTVAIPWAMTSFRVRRAAYTLSRAKYVDNKPLPDYMLPRTDVMNSLSAALLSTTLNTVLVYGVRGSGKTTAIAKYMKARLGVRAWSLSSTKGDAAIIELNEKWAAMFRPWQKLEDMDFGHQVCKHIIASKRSLVLVISVEAEAEPGVLRNALQFCKMKSYNTGNLRIVVDISSSRTAVALRTNLPSLRVTGVFVGPISKPEASILLDHKLPESWTAPRKNQTILEITDRLDLYLLNLIDAVEGIKAGMSVEQARAYVVDIYDVELTKAEEVLKDFDKAVERKLLAEPYQPACPSLKLENGGLDTAGIAALTTLIKFTDFAKLTTEIGSPHIFDIDPFTLRVSLNGRVMSKAFNDHYPTR